MNTLDKLLAKDYNYMQYAMNSSVDNIDQQIVSLTAERDALLGTLDSISLEIIDYLENNVATATTTIPCSADSATEFYCIGDYRSLFTLGDVLIFSYDGNIYKTAEVTGDPTYEVGSEDSITTVPIGPAHTVGITPSWEIDLKKYNSTTYITQREGEYEFTYDHLYHPLGTSGSYGVVPRITALENSKTMVSNNKTHADLTTENYLRFTDWGDGTVSGVTDEIKDALLDNTTETSAGFESMVSFSCSGDMTSILYVGKQILIDCGTDGFRAGDVETTTYFPPSAGDFTLVNVLPDWNLPVLTENFTSVSASGSIIDLDLMSLISTISFTCSGDKTSILSNNMDITCDCGVDGLKECWITSIKYDEGLNWTKVDIMPNFYLTTNLNSVSINGVPLVCGIEYVNELAFKVTGDQTLTLTPGLSGVSCDCGPVDGIIQYTIRTSEHVVGRGDYTLITFTNGDDTSGIPITENIEKVYIQPS